MTACASCGADNPAGFRFCGRCAAPLLDETAGRRKTVSIVFCDLVDSTRLGSSLDTEVLRSVLAAYWSGARSVLERHGGTVELIRVLESGDEIYVTGRFKRTHRHDLATPLGRIAASGKSLDLLFVDYFRVRHGKIIECEAVRDRLDMILQLRGAPS